jgi:hypothetical protein
LIDWLLKPTGQAPRCDHVEVPDVETDQFSWVVNACFLSMRRTIRSKPALTAAVHNSAGPVRRGTAGLVIRALGSALSVLWRLLLAPSALYALAHVLVFIRIGSRRIEHVT